MKNIWFFILSLFSFRCSFCKKRMKRYGNDENGNEIWICKKCKRLITIKG
ncbi:hypothetical protein DAC16_25 [Bacteroides phage DAC16]|nr:hypothetical protein DAC16_25 [Bacteroides phage DAC16]QIG64043.1 hypothetical protein DAC22_29 [Bacteroides phage DAC22]